MNPHPYDEHDIAVAEDVLARIYSGVDANHAISAVAVLSEVMVARHERDAKRSAQWVKPQHVLGKAWKVLELPLFGALCVAITLLLQYGASISR